jgi:Family of unknown function (DUF5989)
VRALNPDAVVWNCQQAGVVTRQKRDKKQQRIIPPDGTRSAVKASEVIHMGEFLLELWSFMRERKKFWLLPIVICLVLLGSLIVFTSGTAVAPFIYTLF